MLPQYINFLQVLDVSRVTSSSESTSLSVYSSQKTSPQTGPPLRDGF